MTDVVCVLAAIAACLLVVAAGVAEQHIERARDEQPGEGR